MDTKTEWLGYLVQLLVVLLAQVEADIKCICTTYECQREDVVTCTAAHYCYVQYYAKTVDDVGNDVIRGCIDRRQPLLCDNRRPTIHKEEWPVLHCCQSEFCNKDVIPTAPPWLVEATEEIKRNKSLSEKRQLSTNKKASTDSSSQRLQHEYRKDFTLNPIYIAVPTAGVCVLLGIILFAIFLLRRNNQRHFQRNYDLAAGQHCALESAGSHLKFCQNGHMKCPGNNNMTTSNNKGCVVDNQERTSANSESKLLMKV